MKPLISIVMAVYNGAEYLKFQIQSILGQSYKNIELIILDDGSTDGSYRLAVEWAQKDARLHVHQNPSNVGVSKNFLKGLALVRGDLVCFSDQDDVWQDDKIEILSALLLKDPKNMLAYSDLEVCDEHLNVTHRSFWKAAGIKPRKGYLHELPFLRNIVPGCSVMFRKSVADALAGLPGPGPFLHDHLALVLSAAMGKIVYTKAALVRYRQHAQNQIGAFYDSAVNTESIIRELAEKVKWLQSAPFNLPDLNFKKLLIFCECLQCGRLFKRLSFLNYYLFLRDDRLWDKALGILECFSPAVYGKLKKFGKSVSPLLGLRRLVVLGWSLAVLFYFFDQFILLKFHNFLSWLK